VERGSSSVACFPISAPACPDNFANGTMANSQLSLTALQDVDVDFEAAGDSDSNQQIGSIDNMILVDYDSGTTIEILGDFEVFDRAVFHAFIDGCGNN